MHGHGQRMPGSTKPLDVAVRARTDRPTVCLLRLGPGALQMLPASQIVALNLSLACETSAKCRHALCISLVRNNCVEQLSRLLR